MRVESPTPDELLDAYLTRHGIEHFSAKEICTVRSIRHHEVPPRGLWQNIIPTLRLAERLRATLGHPLVVGSGYRSGDANHRVGGSQGSQHMKFRAVDLDLPKSHDDRVFRRELYWKAVELWLESGEDLGLGIYQPDAGRRVHLDTGYRRRYWQKGYVEGIMADIVAERQEHA